MKRYICTQEIKQVDQNAQNPQIEDSMKDIFQVGTRWKRKRQTIRNPTATLQHSYCLEGLLDCGKISQNSQIFYIKLGAMWAVPCGTKSGETHWKPLMAVQTDTQMEQYAELLASPSSHNLSIYKKAIPMHSLRY